MNADWMLGLLAQSQRWDGHMMWGWGMGVRVLSLLLLAGIIVAVVWAVSRSGRPSEPYPTSRAWEILNERYARGEIATEEYRERLDALR